VYCPKAGPGDGTYVPPIHMACDMSAGGMPRAFLHRKWGMNGQTSYTARPPRRSE